MPSTLGKLRSLRQPNPAIIDRDEASRNNRHELSPLAIKVCQGASNCSTRNHKATENEVWKLKYELEEGFIST